MNRLGFSKDIALSSLLLLRVRLFKDECYIHLKASSERCVNRFGVEYMRFLRILLIHWCYDTVCVPEALIFEVIGHKCRVTVYMMVGCGWLRVESRKRTVITPKGRELVEACVKQVQREYSTFWLTREDVKKGKYDIVELPRLPRRKRKGDTL